MSMPHVIALLNEMERDGIVERYAIGGAVGATFCLEPVATLDIDVFITVAGWPVQLLPPTSALVEDALASAVTLDVDSVPARVFTAEHLAAIALETGRAKDKARLLQFVEAEVLHRDAFHRLLARYGLVTRWQHFERTFLDGTT